MAIHRVEDGFVISSAKQWLPGIYDTEHTARYAFRFEAVVLQRLQDEANARAGGTRGVITRADLKGAT